MESHGSPGRVHVSQTVYEKLKDKFIFEPRGTIPVKGKGEMETYFLNGRIE
jgi:class 3 adenylate cyclase